MSWIAKPLLVACDDGLLPKSLGSVSKNGVPYKLLTLFYLAGMIPLVLHHNISFITKFTTANSLLTKLFVCIALFSMAANHSEILNRSALHITAGKAKFLATFGGIVLCVLSYSLFANLSSRVVIFLVVLLVLAILYVTCFRKTVEVPNDLVMDYTTKK